MDITKKLIFYNKEGYPYNFQYDDINEKWVGKLLFDENSTDTFKDIGMYIFEKVPPINFSDTVDLIPLQIFNNSGITFIGDTYSGVEITSIENVNTNGDFYSKWVYGDNIHRKFPKGTFISLSGLTGTGGYLDEFPTGNTYYYSVYDTKQGAILITTPLSNDTYLTTPYTVTGGYVNSYNVISIPDYNQDLMGWFTGLTLYEYDSTNDNYKKLTISGSEDNDRVINFKNTGYTYGFIKDFDISGVTGSTMTLEVTLYTERPKLYTGAISIISGDTATDAIITFNENINTTIQTGITMLFEDYSGNLIASGYSYNVSSYVTESYVDQLQLNFIKDVSDNISRVSNYIQIGGDYTSIFSINDEIRISGVTSVNKILNDNRYLKINSIYFDDNNKTNIFTSEYVISETGNTYNIYKKIKEIDTINTVATGNIENTEYTEAICFLNTNVINYTQNIIYSGFTTTAVTYEEQLVDDFNSKNEYGLSRYGINTYYLDGDFIVESEYDFYSRYFDCRLLIDDQEIIPEYKYSTGHTSGTTYKYHILSYDDLVNEKIYLNEFEKLSRNYHADIILTLNDDTFDYGFTLEFNNNEYYVPYNDVSGNTSNQYETVYDFVNKYSTLFYINGFTLSLNAYSGYTSGITLSVDGLYPNSIVTNIGVKVNLFSSYILTENYRNCLVIAGNEIQNPSLYNFYDIDLATGMILSISGSTYYPNNKEYNILGLTNDTIQLSYQGIFNYQSGVTIDFSTRETIRKPRGYYNKDVYYKFSWGGDEVNDSIFYYDFSGNQLQYTSGLTYTGPTPLTGSTSDLVFLNKKPNRQLDKVSIPQYQQTIFDSITHELENLNSSVDYNFIPEPLPVYIGYNSQVESVDSKIMKIEKIENLIFSGVTSNNTGTTGFEYNNFIISGSTIVYDNSSFLFDFNSMGFEIGQYISMKFTDNAITGQTIFRNPYNYKITDLSFKTITVDTTYYTLTPFNTSGSTYNFTIKVEPKEIGVITLYGETEIEDERFKINLNNIGANLDPDDAYIFKENDINDKGIDYLLLNRKRKELLSNYTEIYNYVGSYKSLINAINYFGYNDLELYEYYRNVDSKSPLYKKLFKILIPDIFDNSVEGWNEIDWLKNDYNTDKYKKTNLFNLTYKITDFYGNYLEYYSLDEIQIKLGGLVRWLRKNVIPLSANILDITGVADSVTDIYQEYNSANWVTKYTSEQEVLSVNFNFIQTLNQNDNYFITVNFYTNSGVTTGTTGGISPEYYSVNIRTFSLDENSNKLIPVQYFDLYKTDLDSFTFEANKTIDPYIYVETVVYNDYGLGYKNNRVFKFDEKRNYILINNNFDLSYYKYLYSNDQYFVLIDDGNFYVFND